MTLGDDRRGRCPNGLFTVRDRRTLSDAPSLLSRSQILFADLDKLLFRKAALGDEYDCSYVVYCARGHHLHHKPHRLRSSVYRCLVRPAFTPDPSSPRTERPNSQPAPDEISGAGFVRGNFTYAAYAAAHKRIPRVSGRCQARRHTDC